MKGRWLNITLVVGALGFLTMGLIQVNSPGESQFSNAEDGPAMPPMETGINVGDHVPDIVMKGPDGKKHKLHKLIRKDQIVLIDFWASWCKPCRRMNPTIVQAYEKYKDAEFKEAKGFTVFSVSLDTDKLRWKKAIEQDDLSWKYHVSDLQGWNSEVAKEFKVTSIPHSILVNSEGIIIAKNLHGRELHMTTDEHVESF